MGRLGYLIKCFIDMDKAAMWRTVNIVHGRSGKGRISTVLDIVRCGTRYGAGQKDYLLYEFERLTPEQRSTFVTRGINNDIVKLLNDPAYYQVLDDKRTFNREFGAYLHRGWLDLATASREEALAYLGAEGRDQVIAKPCDASCGEGVEKLSRADFASVEALYDYLLESSADIVEDVVVQHPDMARINPSSVNTIRVFTVMRDGEPDVLYTVLRMGSGTSHVDNINAGGLFAPLDAQTGRISIPACDKNFKVYEKHPTTGLELVGYQMPMWDKVIALCLEAQAKIPQLGYVGWDVAVTEDGPLFIESNSIPGYDLYPQLPSQAPDGIGYLPELRRHIKGI